MSGRVKKGDTVVVISGKDKAREGKVLRIYPKEGRLLVEGLNLKKRHRRPRKAGEKGSIVELPMPFHLAKVMPKCPGCGKPVRIGFRILEKGERKRVCKKCGHVF